MLSLRKSLVLPLASAALWTPALAQTTAPDPVLSKQQVSFISAESVAFSSFAGEVSSRLDALSSTLPSGSYALWGAGIESSIGVYSFAFSPSLVLNAPKPSYLTEFPSDVRTDAERLFTSFWKGEASIDRNFYTALLASQTPPPSSANATGVSKPLPKVSQSSGTSPRPLVSLSTQTTPSSVAAASGPGQTTATAATSQSTGAAASPALPFQLGALAAGAVGAAAVLL